MSASRITIPENFFDVTSSQLLCQPEPQYLFAQLFLEAIQANLPIPSTFGNPGREPPSPGAEYRSAEADRLALATSPLPSSLFALGIDFAKTPGNTVRVNRPAFANTTYTLQSRRIAPASTISTTAQDFGSEQTHLTLERFGGPYSNAASAVQPFAIESFDANMGVFQFQSMVGNQLMRDFHRFLDQVHVVLGSVGTSIYPDGMTQDNDATSAGMYPMTFEQISRTEQIMDDANLPTLPDGKRMLVITPLQWKQLKHDPEFEFASQNQPTWNILYPGYVASIGRFHIFTSSTLQKINNGSSVAIQYGMALAPGLFMGGMGRPPRVTNAIDDNYGETAKVIWLADLAFGVADSRFCYTVKSSA